MRSPSVVAEPTTYRERLSVPSWWWFLGLFMGGSFALACAVYLPYWLAIIVVLAIMITVFSALFCYGNLGIVVDQTGLSAAGRRIEWRYVRLADPLTEQRTRARLTVEANAAAELITRPYVSRAVEVTLSDPSDPHPYWLISTRRPDALAEAINHYVQPATTNWQTIGGAAESPAVANAHLRLDPS